MIKKIAKIPFKIHLWILIFNMSILSSCNNVDSNTVDEIQNTKIQKTVEELVEEDNKELITRKYDINLGIEEIDYYLEAYKKSKDPYPKEWQLKVINETHVQIENELKKICLDLEKKIKKYRNEVDSLNRLDKMNDKKIIRINRLIDNLERSKNENLQYIDWNNGKQNKE